MLTIKPKVDNLNGLKSVLDRIEKQFKLDSNIKNLHTYLQTKCLKTTKRIAREILYSSGTSNVELYEDYIKNIRISDSDENGFVIKSDLTIYKPPSKHSHGYNFSVSLAFEYGTGIIGEGSIDAPANYKYNVNNNYVIVDDFPEMGWWIPKEKAGTSMTFGESRSGKAVITKGYEGMGIFLNAYAEINKNLEKWIIDFYEKRGGISK